MKVFAIIGLTTLAAVCLALPAEEHIREEVSPLWEQETSLYERMVTPSLYNQQSDLFDSLVELEAGKGKKKAAKKAAPKKKGGKKSAKAGKSVDAKTLKKEEQAAFTAHGKEIAASEKRHNQATLGPFQKHKTVTAAEAKAAKTQEKRMEADTKAQKKAEAEAAKKVNKGAKDATARANSEWKKGVRQVYKIEHPNATKKGLDKEKRDAKFIKTMKKVSQGDAVIANGDSVYLKKGVGNVKFGKAAKKAKKKAKGKKGKKAAKKGKKAAKKAKKKKEITLYQQQTALFEQMVEPRRTIEQKALDDMHDADDLAQNRYNQMFNEALKPVGSVDPIEELVQEDKITPLSDAEERRGAQRVLFQREQELYQESMQPMRTKEDKALDEMRFAEDVMQGELTHAYKKALRK
jgi:hypothetical protein